MLLIRPVFFCFRKQPNPLTLQDNPGQRLQKLVSNKNENNVDRDPVTYPHILSVKEHFQLFRTTLWRHHCIREETMHFFLFPRVNVAAAMMQNTDNEDGDIP